MEHQERWYLDNIALAGRAIVDVGANVGRLSELFWRHGGQSCRVLSVEPQPENVARLRDRIAACGADNWTIAACAVSAREGTVRMRTMVVDYGINSVVIRDEQATEPQGALYPARRLEDLAPDAQVIKVDIEGHEYAVLPTAVPALARAEAWALELHMQAGYTLEDTLGLFASHGFRLAAAGMKKGDPSGSWVSVPIVPTLRWDAIPAAPASADGMPSVRKMLHVIARRE